MKLVFIQTGGTIDKDYPNKTKGWAFEFGEPAINRILKKLNPYFEYKIITAFQKDSLEITVQDRKELVAVIKNEDSSKFIITHGTDTIIKTAKYLSKYLGNKCIVLTGAMRPERFSNSDAPINLGCAIATVQVIEKGVFIAMNGVVKVYTDMNRNLETGQFY